MSGKDERRRTSSAAEFGVIGAVLCAGGYLALTGAVCGESLAALALGAVAGAVCGRFAGRRQWPRWRAWLLMLGVLAAVTLTSGGVGRYPNGPLAFRQAFGEWPGEQVQIVRVRRFGFMDNTTLVVFRVEAKAAEAMLTGSGFQPHEDAMLSLLQTDPAAYDRAGAFRRLASANGVYAEEIPYGPRLRVYRRPVSGALSPRETSVVTLDPDTSLAYLVVEGL
jgi:hypothetical protein